MIATILVVDDEEDVRALIGLGLEMQSDWTVFNASSGEEALSIAAAHRPDLILLDLMMPDMDGRTTLQRLKANPATRQIPVILMSAKNQSTVQARFSGLEVAAIFTKPLRPLMLPDQILKVLRQNGPNPNLG